jgi:iron complex outermembrane receptor protein
MGDKEAPDYVLSNSGNREANFSGDIKFTGKNRMFLPTVITTLQLNFECFTYGECERFVQFTTNKVPSVVNGFTYAIRNPKQKVQHHLAKVNYNYYFDETAFLRYSILSV